jgi:hypothetical protein
MHHLLQEINVGTSDCKMKVYVPDTEFTAIKFNKHFSVPTLDAQQALSLNNAGKIL